MIIAPALDESELTRPKPDRRLLEASIQGYPSKASAQSCSSFSIEYESVRSSWNPARCTWRSPEKSRTTSSSIAS